MYRSTIHFARSGLIIESLKRNFSIRSCLSSSQLLRHFIGKPRVVVADSLYDYDYSRVNDDEGSDEEEAAIVIETHQSKPVRHTVADQSKLVSYTDSNSEKEEDLHVDVNFDEPVDLVIN